MAVAATGRVPSLGQTASQISVTAIYYPTRFQDGRYYFNWTDQELWFVELHGFAHTRMLGQEPPAIAFGPNPLWPLSIEHCRAHG